MRRIPDEILRAFLDDRLLHFFSLLFFRLKNSMLADEADNPGFLLLLEQVTIHSLNSVV